jgi:L-ascorbate peroxidase
LLKLSTDRVVFVDEGFKPFAEAFRDSQDAFFKSYAVAHKKLSELGSKFEPAEGIKL